MATPAAVLSILVKTQGAQAAASQLGTLDKSGRRAAAGLAKTEATAKRSSKTFSMIGSTAKLAGVGLGAAGLAGGIKTAISEYREAQKVGAQTNAVLKSTKSAANVTAKEIQNLAGAISKKTGIDDETIQSSENMLLTFTKLRNETGKGNDIFNQATQTVTDMSVALGQSGKSSAIQLGKALNDPIKGITALRRVGVSFTADQQKQITTLENTGHHLEAQKIILRELRTEFAGSAAAQATAGDKFRVSLGNLAEAAGAVLVPQIDKVAGVLTRLMDQMVQGVGVGGALVSTFRTTGNVIGSVIGAITGLINGFREGNAVAVILVTTVGALTAGFVAYRTAMAVAAAATRVMAAVQIALNVAMTANPIGLVIAALAALGAALVIAYTRSRTFREVVDTLWHVLRDGLVGAIRAVLGAFSSFLGAVSAVARAVGADGLANKAQQGQRAIDDLRDSLRNVPDKKNVDVKVKISLDGQDIDVTNAKPLSPTPPGGDGPGVIGSRINDLVRADGKVHAGIKALVSDGLGSMVPGIGGGGGNLQGAKAIMAPFAALGAKFGLHISPGGGKRPPGTRTSSGGISLHSTGNAIDLANGRGPDDAKMRAFNALRSRYGSRLAELIYTPAGGRQIKDGQPFRYTGSVAADHYDHVHVAFTGGSRALGQAGNRGDGLGRFIGDGLGDEQQWLNDSWAKVAPLFGKSASNTPLPSLFKHIRFSGSSPFVGVATTPGKGMETAELLWPRWLWQSSKGQKKLDERMKLQLFIHEMAHRFQSADQIKAEWMSEGGAEAFARIMMGRQFGGAIRSGADPYNAFVTRVMKEKGVGWVTSGQFANATAGAGMPGLGLGGNAKQIWQFLRGHGFTPAQAAGIVGSLQQESGLSTSATNPRSGAYGIGQWLGARKTALMARANPGSLSTQLQYLWSELQGPESAALKRIKGTHSIADAAAAWTWGFERPGKAEANMGARVSNSRAAFNMFANVAGKGGGGATSSAGSGAASTAAKVNPFDQKIANADLAIQMANTAPNRIGSRSVSRSFQQVQAMTAKRKLIGSRIRSIRRALKGKLSGTKRLALTQELTQRLQEHAQLGTDIQALRHPAAAGGDGGSIGDIGGGAGTGDAGDPNQALIDSNAALQAKIDEQIAAEKEHTDVLAAVKAEIKRQTDFATAVTNTSNFQLTKSLADLLSGQIVGYGVAGRKMTPGTGVEHAY